MGDGIEVAGEEVVELPGVTEALMPGAVASGLEGVGVPGDELMLLEDKGVGLAEPGGAGGQVPANARSSSTVW